MIVTKVLRYFRSGGSAAQDGGWQGSTSAVSLHVAFPNRFNGAAPRRIHGLRNKRRRRTSDENPFSKEAPDAVGRLTLVSAGGTKTGCLAGYVTTSREIRRSVRP
jgi:hypothetical protein